MVEVEKSVDVCGGLGRHGARGAGESVVSETRITFALNSNCQRNYREHHDDRTQMRFTPFNYICRSASRQWETGLRYLRGVSPVLRWLYNYFGLRRRNRMRVCLFDRLKRSISETYPSGLCYLTTLPWTRQV